MRRCLLILITLSLSWVTTTYACDMSDAVAQPNCCCKAGASPACPEPAASCSVDAMLHASGDGCCSWGTTSGASVQGQSESLTVPALHLLGLLPIPAAPERPPSKLPAPPRLPARVRCTVPVYLLVGRLLR